MPGGDGDYYDYGKFVFEKVKEINDNGTYLPLWATCLGYENLSSYVAEDGWGVIDVFKYDGGSLELEFVTDPRDTRMFSWLGNDAFLLEDNPITYNSHTYGIAPETFETDKNLKDFFTVTSISYLPDTGAPFVASIEAKDYPIYGV